MRVLSIVGARPQFLKAAVVSQEIHLAGPKTEAILAAVEAILRQDFANQPRPDYYGAGRASARIVRVLQWFMNI